MSILFGTCIAVTDNKYYISNVVCCSDHNLAFHKFIKNKMVFEMLVCLAVTGDIYHSSKIVCSDHKLTCQKVVMVQESFPFYY